MKQRLWSSVTATLLITALGTVPSSQAVQTSPALAETEVPLSAERTQPEVTASPEPEEVAVAPPTEVLKVGEYQTQAGSQQDENVIAKIQPHQQQGREAATLYVRDIPVLTFLGTTVGAANGSDTAMTAAETKVGEAVHDEANASNIAPLPGTTESQETTNKTPTPTDGDRVMAANLNNDPSSSDPLWRASAIAAQLNQLSRDGVDANSITVRWEADSYIIEVNGQHLVTLDAQTILPDTTHHLATDALQATNRLRRLMGDAPPLTEIAGVPRPAPAIAIEPVINRIKGWASWYGPGFHGRLSASGEVYNQNDLTAAHPSLPFGTRVRVTNLDNGNSVVVRINDRGPYVGDRIIDLSAEAARVIGMVNSGVAPVQLDILGERTTATINTQ